MNEEGKGIHQVEMDDLDETMIWQVPLRIVLLSIGGKKLLVSLVVL